jgi:hypothetical protein
MKWKLLNSPLLRPFLFLIRAELRLYVAYARAIRRRKDVPEGSVEIEHGQTFRMLLGVLIAVTPIEVGAIEILFHFFIPIVALRVALWVITLITLLWLVGMLLSMRVYPHYANEQHMVFRYATFHTVEIETSWVTAVRLKKRDCVKNKTLELDGDLLALNEMRETQIELEFATPQRPVINSTPYATEVRCFAFSADKPPETRNQIAALLEPPTAERRSP